MNKRANWNPGAKWKGNYDKKTYVMRVGGYNRGQGFMARSNLPGTFNADNGYTFIGGGKPESALTVANRKIAELEASAKRTQEQNERALKDARSSAEYYRTEFEMVSKNAADYRDKFSAAERTIGELKIVVTHHKSALDLAGKTISALSNAAR